MSLRKKLLLALLGVLLLLPTAALYIVASTEAGLAFIASRLQGKLGPVTMETGAVSGSLTGGFHIESLRVQHRLSDSTLRGIDGRIELWPLLLRRHVVLDQLHIADASVQLLHSDEKRTPKAPQFLPATLRVDAPTLAVDKLLLTLVSGTPTRYAGISGNLTLLPKQIRLQGAQLDYQLESAAIHMASTSTRVLAALPVGLEGDLALAWHFENQPAWKVDATFDGDLDSLPATIDIREPFLAHAVGAMATLDKGWTYAGDADVRDLDLNDFGGGEALGIITAQLAVTAVGKGLSFTARGPVTPPGLKAGAMQLDFSGSYDDRRLTIASASVLHAPSGSRATARGTVEIIDNGPRLALSGEWSTFRWPLAVKEEAAFTSPRGRYTLDGLKPWKVHAEGDVVAAGLPAMPARADGRLGSQSFEISDASVQLFGGSAKVKGEARWQPAESWRIEGRMRDFDPAQLRADLPGKLDFDFKAQGAPFGDAGTIDFNLSHLAGTLRGQKASGNGRFTRPGGGTDWQFHGVDLRVGSTHLQLDGALGTTRNLTFALDADDLSLFDATARGRFSARGRYAGSADAPVMLFKARGSDFEWQGYRVASLDADLDIDLGASSHARGRIDLSDIRHGARTVRKATLNLTGTGEAQRIALDVDAAPLRTALAAEGAIREGLWQGQVNGFTITDNADLSLRLEAPAPLALNFRQVELGQLCLTAEKARGCADGKLDPDGRWNTRFSAEAMPLRAFTAGLTQDVDYEGTINLRGELAGSRGALPTGKVHGELADAQLRHRLGNGRDERLALGSGSVDASATTADFSVKVALDAGASGSILGELHGDRNTVEWSNYPIRGTLDARTDGLSLLDIYIGGIDKATGQLITRVSIGGTLGAPTVAGMLQLRDASIDIYQINLALRDLSLEARFDTNALDITGRSRLGDGMAQFNGRLAWRDGEPYGDLHLQGDRLLVVNVPEARIEASPKLDFKLAGRRIEATGEVQIPKAMLEPADLTNAVLASSDEVLVGAPEIDPSRRWTVVSNIRLVLGDDVNVDSLGLTARLGGSLQVRTDENQVTRGQGELNIASGKYMALGRLLDIERGRLIFNNVPVGDPGVDLRAQKVFPDVTAGINVRGSLRAPRLTFYSEPSIPQSQIASLILAGGSLESVQDSQRSGAARNDLLAQGGAILAQRVGSQVGVDDVGIESDLNNDASLVLGKYLSPRLYISYGISLAEAINTLKLRYTIGDRWTIKTEAGKARSADIVYTFKKK